MSDPKQGTVEDRRSAAAPGDADPATEAEGGRRPCREGRRSPVTSSGDTGDMDFSTFVLSLATSAYLHMGTATLPEVPEATVNLPLAKQSIDILGMLEEKTRCNLTEREESLLQQVLFDLRLQYVEVSNGAAQSAD